MKKIYSVFLIVSSLLLCCYNINSQVLVGLQGERAQSIVKYGLPDAGWGFGLGIFSNPNLITNRHSILPVRFSYGNDFNFSGLGTKTVKDIPLISPQTGNAKAELHNWCGTADFVARFYFGGKDNFITPYIDGIAGVRFSHGSMFIIPDNISSTQGEKDTSFWHTGGLNLGAGVGCLISLSRDAFVDLSVVYSNSNASGKLLDLSSAQKIGNALDYTSKKLPYDMVMINLGFIFKIEGDGYPNYYSGSSHSSGHYHSSCHSFHSSGGSHIHIHMH
ncbi:MAG: hypothetical protein ACXVPY_09260 [Bacteroidia bacterium]